MVLRWALALGIGGLLVFFGVMKFTGAAHIFPYMEYKMAGEGIAVADYVYPWMNYATGALEILAGALLILPFTRRVGSLLAALPFLGAVAFHLSPYLGTSTPDGYSDPKPVDVLAAGGPFARSDFTEATSMTLFIIACVGLAAAIVNLVVQRAR